MHDGLWSGSTYQTENLIIGHLYFNEKFFQMKNDNGETENNLFLVGVEDNHLVIQID